MRMIPSLLLLAAVAAGAPQERVWQGYVFADKEGRVQLGWAVVAMGVISMPAHVVGGDLAKKMKPLLAPTKNTYTFWNYQLEEGVDKALPHLPRALVRLRGKVDGKKVFFSGGEPLVMANPTLERVEFVSEAWIREWAKLYQLDISYSLVARKRKSHDEKHAATVLAILKRMIAMPEATDAQRKLLKDSFPKTKLGTWHRRMTEQNIQHWLDNVVTKHKLKLDGFDKLPPLPPTGYDVQKWFLECETKAEFLKKAEKEWPHATGALKLVYYEAHDGGVSWRRTTVESVLQHWTEETYRKHRATTLKQ